ncbi:MAG TPA: type VI secretion system baseplate subunit TssG [Cellvibrio sp.]|nr:type VI secretion system baseplate subunit TssG [Cellvibrio sp.]
MSSPSRRKNASVIELLLKAPHQYGFFQAVRLLERAILIKESSSPDYQRSRKHNPVALFVPPVTEILRFKTRTSFSFPNNEIFSVSAATEKSPAIPWEMQVNFMSLAGSIGVLPYHYTELILQRLKQKDESLAQFLDIFNHRTISLFYQAGTKYSLPIEYERKKLNSNFKKNRSLSSQALLSLIGLGTQGLTDRLQVNDESLLFYGGLLTQKVRTSTGLKQILADYFDLPVRIQEFVGQWQELIPDIRTRIASKLEPKGQNAALSRSAMLGARGWIAQGKIRILLGPLNKEQFYRFAPGTKALAAMNDMVQMYLGLEHDYEFVIEVNRADLPNKIMLNKKAPPILCWNTWLSTNEQKSTANANETLKITVSAKRVH